MRCRRCRQENPPGARFCNGCGEPLPTVCSACAYLNVPGSRFCNQCGAPLESAAAAPAPAGRFTSPETYTPRHLAERILTSRSAVEGERKQVTVLFADLKGSMELLADRDPEEARRLLDPVLDRMMEAVHRYEGTVNQVMGDGIMALFGAPLALEDHAVRACYAALRMQERVTRYGDETQRRHGVPLQIRVGLNSGEVVVRSIGSDLHMDYTAVGQTTHLSARMEQTAKPGSILLTAETLRLAEGHVEARRLGPVVVKGLSAPVEAFELTGPSRAQSRLHAALSRGLSPFVGRAAELEHLGRALEQAREGRGQVVAVVGDPGVGKSRLFFEFTRSPAADGWLLLETAAVSYGRTLTYLPVVALLRAYFEVGDHEAAERVQAKVTERVLTLDDRLTDAIPLLLFLLEALPEDHPLRSLDPSLRQAHVLNAAKRLLLRETQRQPVLLIVENLHWIDPDSQALFEGLVESLPTARFLLLVNYRAEFQHGWGNKSYYTQLRLDPLRPASAEALLERLLGSAADLIALKRLLIERTQGNPFFLEETVRTLVETDVLVGDRGAYRLVKPLPTIQVPASVQAVLAARIDRLPPEEKRLLQAAAVIGAHVSVPLLRAIAELPPERLQQSLTHLQAAEFLYERALFPDVTYTFTHALTHEVAYGSLLQEQRRALHARIVDAFEELYPDRLAEHTEWLAHHVARGEVWSKALSYFRPVGSGQVPLIMAGSFWWLGDHARALETAREDLRIASDFSHFPLQLQAYVRLGQIYHSLGEYPRAIECLRRNVASLDGELLREPFDLPAPPSVLSRAWLTWCLGECGEFAEATVLAAEARQIAEALEEPYSRILAAAALGVLQTAKAEPEAAIAPLEAALARARDRRLVVLVPLVAAPLGYAAALAGRVATGLAVLEQAVEQAAAMQFKANQALRLVWLGEARVLAGHPDLARALATQALALSEAQAERGHQAHALRLLGEIAAGDAHADAPVAEASYRQALALAEALGMRPLQARCHRGLGELYGRIGETERARPEMEAAIALRESMERPR